MHILCYIYLCIKFSIFKKKLLFSSKLFRNMAKSNCDKKYKILILGDSSVGKVRFILFL